MSTLRKIMKRLAEGEHNKQNNPSSVDFSEIVKCHVDEYQTKLESCTPAMLQYEWAWLKEHMEALELCLGQSTMCSELGGRLRVEMLLEESKQFQTILQEMFNKRMIHPSNQHRAVNPVEHAWEVSQKSLRDTWGFE